MLNIETFFEIMTDVLEEEIDSLNYKFDDDIWSSIAVVSCLAEFDDQFDILLDGDKLSNCKNIDEVYKLLMEAK